MTKVDERSVVPPVDAAARERVAAALDVEGVVAAYLTGSQATGRAGPLSDVDLAVWLEPSAPDDLRGKLWVAACEALRTDEIDLVVLDRAPPLLQHRALRDGVLILERDHDERIRRETRAVLDYLDTKPLRQTFAAAMRLRLANGTYGRSRQG